MGLGRTCLFGLSVLDGARGSTCRLARVCRGDSAEVPFELYQHHLDRSLKGFHRLG